MGDTMRTTALLACLLLAGTAAGCSSQRSQDEIAADCEKALSSKATKTNRPNACKGLTQDNYDALLMHWVLQQQGVLDENGDVDMGELLNGATSQP